MSIYFYGCMTMDGYLADKNHNLGWLYESGTSEETGYEKFYSGIQITLMGKKTFEAIEKTENISGIYPTTKNYVFTHSKKLSRQDFIPVNANVIDFVKNIGKSKNVWIVGGNTLLAPLLNNDMIDTIFLQVAPVLLGEGIPLFTQKEALKHFYLESVKQYGQFAELIYQKNKLTKNQKRL